MIIELNYHNSKYCDSFSIKKNKIQILQSKMTRTQKPFAITIISNNYALLSMKLSTNNDCGC